MVKRGERPDDASLPSGVAGRVHRVAGMAAGLVRILRRLSGLAAISAAWLWIALFFLVGSIPHFLLAAPAALVGAAMLLPALVVGVAVLGLGSLTRLPARVSASGEGPGEKARSGQRPKGLLRRLWAIRRELIGYKVTLARYAAAVRLFTLPALVVVSIAVVLCILQILLAVVSVPVVILALLVF